MPPPSLVATANRVVPFSKAAQWAGLWSRGEARERGNKVSCPFCWDGGGRDPAMRVYPDHSFCFAGCGNFSVVRLLAMTWGLTYDEAAHQALEKSGWKPPTVENRWAAALREPDPDLGFLANALREFCAGADPLWQARQYDPSVAGQLSRCLGLLPAVRTEQDCVLWLEMCKKIMISHLREQTEAACSLYSQLLSVPGGVNHD